MIAIYSRKSKFTNKGDSIENQVEMCKEYAYKNFEVTDDSEFVVYEDEGYSGKNTLRPAFQRMMQAVSERKLTHVLCYRLDRIGRNVVDLGNTMNKLNKYNVSFISITERFDTTTPLGQFMITLSGALAQMERELISERVRDNMLMLARTGRWLGGKAPYGFNTERKSYVDESGVKREYSILVPNEAEMAVVSEHILRGYLSLGSITAVRRKLFDSGISNRNGDAFTDTHIKNILYNPVYCAADSDSYEYFVEHGVTLINPAEEFIGDNGYMPYNRNETSNGTMVKRDMSEWCLAIGAHPATISGEIWIEIQKKLAANKERYTKPGRGAFNNYALLTGVLFCGKCGTKMSVQHQKDYKGNRSESANDYFYKCDRRKVLGVNGCPCPGISGTRLDETVRKEIFNWRDPDSMVGKQLRRMSDASYRKAYIVDSIAALTTQIDSRQKKIDQLVNVLATSDSLTPRLIESINKQVATIDAEIKELQEKLDEAQFDQNDMQRDIDKADKIEKIIMEFESSFQSKSIPDQRVWLQKCIDRVTYDGENVDIFVGGDEG